MAASGTRLAILAENVPTGGTFDVPFPGNRNPVFIYEYRSGRWEPVTVLLHGINDASVASIDLAGSRAAQGLPQADRDGNESGIVWSYTADPLWRREGEVRSPAPAALSFFGWDVALEGETLAVVALGSGNTPSALYLYSHATGVWNHVQTLSPPTPFKRFSRVEISRGWIAATTFENNGAVFLYQNSGSWELKQTLLPEAGKTFGGPIALAGDMLAVSSVRETPGAVHVYQFSNGRWSFSQRLDASDRFECTYFGTSLSMTPHKLLVGAPSACIDGKQNAGLVRLYLRVNNAWIAAGDFRDDTPAQGESFGSGIVVGDQHIFMNTVLSDGGFLTTKVEVYSGPADPPKRRRAARR